MQVETTCVNIFKWSHHTCPTATKPDNLFSVHTSQRKKFQLDEGWRSGPGLGVSSGPAAWVVVKFRASGCCSHWEKTRVGLDVRGRLSQLHLCIRFYSKSSHWKSFGTVTSIFPLTNMIDLLEHRACLIITEIHFLGCFFCLFFSRSILQMSSYRPPHFSLRP